MSTRIASFYVKQSSLAIESVTYWSDAMVVLRWINSSHRRFVAFVANRVSEMLGVSEPSQWRHVPGDLNPADELSRGLMPAELCQDHHWFTGPPFLSLPPGNWPSAVNVKDLAATPEELVECLAVSEAGEPLDALIDRTDNLHRLVRVAAWILRFVGNVRARIRSKRTVDTPRPSSAFGKYAPALATSPDSKSGRQLDVDEYRNARSVLIYVAQRSSFADDLGRLRKGQPVRRESRLLQLSPFLDSRQLLLVGGRL